MWNGSYLGKVERDSLRETTYKGSKYASVYINRMLITGAIKYPHTNITCLLDEMKPLFGIAKVGTHSFRVGNRTCVIKRCSMSNGSLVLDIPLRSVDVPPLDRDKVRRIMVYRELVGVTMTSESSIVYRMFPGCTIILDLIDRGMVDGEKLVVPESMLSKWSPEETIPELGRRFLSLYTREDVDKFAVRVEEKWNNLCSTMAPEESWRSQRIRMRVKKILSEGLPVDSFD